MKNNNIENMLPLQPMTFNILFTLVSKPLHGYQIRKLIEAETGQKASTSSLYRHIDRMEDNGMIEEAEQPADNDDPRRQYYQLTDFGMTVYAAEYNRLRALLQSAPDPEVTLQPRLKWIAADI